MCHVWLSGTWRTEKLRAVAISLVQSLFIVIGSTVLFFQDITNHLFDYSVFNGTDVVLNLVDHAFTTLYRVDFS